jgi:hypothetical protein
MHFRYGLFELSKGRDPEEAAWRTKGHPTNRFTRTFGDLRTITEAIQHSECLHQILSEASLQEIATLCRFPDYLGYLGLGLHYTHQLEQQHRLLTPVWVLQLSDMVEEGTSQAELLRQKSMPDKFTDVPLIWSDLDGMEHAIKPAFRVRQFD